MTHVRNVSISNLILIFIYKEIIYNFQKTAAKWTKDNSLKATNKYMGKGIQLITGK